MQTVKGKICTVCGHDHWCYCEGEEEEDNAGYYLCCPCDGKDKIDTMMHEPVYAD